LAHQKGLREQEKGEKREKQDKERAKEFMVGYLPNLTYPQQQLLEQKLVAMVDDTPSTNKSRLPPSIKALKERPGVKITDFHSTIESESL
jgi:hypothetical protein